MRRGAARWALAAVLAAASAAALDAGAPRPRPAAAPHRPWQELLARHVVRGGEVDYQSWRDRPADVAQLDAYLKVLMQPSAAQARALQADRAARFAYWVNLYNALVVREVLRAWPVRSVREIGAGDGGEGDAFFKQPRFSVGGKTLSLDQIEAEALGGALQDARVHFALNCGARSCPPLTADALGGPLLDAQLDAAARAFVNDPHNVAVDDAARTVSLNRLFDWYQKDFAAYAAEKKAPADTPGFLSLFAAPPLGAALERARAGRYRTAFTDYDWQLNAGRGAAVAPSGKAGLGVGERLPELAWAGLDGGTVRPRALLGKVVVIDFWATYCQPCRATFPLLDALYRQQRAQGLEVLAVAVEPASPAIAKFAAEARASFPIAVDAEQAALEPPLAVTALPTSLVVDRKGVVRARHQGYAPGDVEALARTVRALLAEKP